MTSLPPAEFDRRWRALERGVARHERWIAAATNAFGMRVDTTSAPEGTQVATPGIKPPPVSAVVPHPQNVVGVDPWTPSKPLISIQLGVVSVTWDGHGAQDEEIPANFAWIEVHRSQTSADFEPDPLLTRVGHMRASGAATFTDQVYGEVWWYRFVMVNTEGQRSGPSEATVGVLLQVADADIVTVAADKMITGELQAGVRIIAGPSAGTHAELRSDGFRAYVDDPVDGIPNEVVRVGTSDADTVAIADAAGNTVASMDIDGKFNGQGASLGGSDGPVWYTDPVDGSVSLLSGVEIYGREFVTGYIDILPRGNQAISYRTDTSAYTTTEQPYIQLDAVFQAGRLYRVHGKGVVANNTSGQRAIVGLRMTTDGSAAGTTSTARQFWRTPSSSSAGQAQHFYIHDEYGVSGSSDLQVSFLLTVFPEGTAGSAARFSSALADPTFLSIDDIGLYRGDTGIDRTGGTPPPTKKTYVTTWTSTSSGTYRGDGTKRASSDTTDVVQGYNSFNGDGKGLWIFPSSMQTTLSGSTVSKVEVYAYANHWYYNAGGTALIKVHGYSSAPASSPSMASAGSSANWPNPGGRWITLPSSVNASFASGAYKGFGMGPSGSTNLTYYGRFNGGTGAKIRVTYIK